MTFDTAFDALIGNEGGYSFNTQDPGGETMFGVTARVAIANGYTGSMRNFTRDQAKDIYRRQYWMPIRGFDLPDPLAFQVFDAAVNSGQSQAAKWLQEVVGATADGIIGAGTLAQVAKYNPIALAAVFNGYRLQFMTDLPTWGAFSRGWARRVASNLKLLKE